MGILEPAQLRMLRQGRGNGLREVLLAGPPAAGDVIACVLDDPRWDRQVEERDQYYARLLVQLDGDVQPLQEVVLSESERDESDFWLPIGVLAEMARRGHAYAGTALASAIRTGRRWLACLDALEAAGGETLIGAVVCARDIEGLIAHVDVETLIDATQTIQAPWQAWATELPALRFVSGTKTQGQTEPKPMSGPVRWVASRIREPALALEPNMMAPELLELANTPGASRQVRKILETRSDETTLRVLRHAATHGTPEQRMLALHILGERDCRDFVAEAEQFLRSESRLLPDQRKEHRTRHAFLRYLEQLPASVTLELARQWFTEPWPLSLAAEEILTRHATQNDRPILEEAGLAALHSANMYRLCSVVEALATIGAPESLPFLAEVYSEAPYSYARRRVVKALAPHAAHEVAGELLVEGLWDCESESRELACRAVSARENADHLAEIVADEFEEPEVRQAAAR